jgi:diacylglycerol kinase (ATP)
MASRRQGTCVILNPAARAAEPDQVRSLIGTSAEIWTTSAQGEAVELARRAVRDGFATVVAAGGDGTLNEVVNGLAEDPDGVVCGILPLGTGNDFARTAGIPRDPPEAWRAIERRRVRAIDLGSLERERDRRWFVNMAVGGAIDQFHDRLTDDLKQRWGPFAYLRAGAEAISALLNEVGPHHVELELDGGARVEREVWSVAVANGRTVGGGIPAAPLADPGDGLLDCVVIGAVRGLEMAKLSASVLLGRHCDGPLDDEAPVFCARARRVVVRSSPEMPFTVDGEVCEGSVAVFVAHPGALDLIVGPEE